MRNWQKGLITGVGGCVLAAGSASAVEIKTYGKVSAGIFSHSRKAFKAADILNDASASYGLDGVVQGDDQSYITTGTSYTTNRFGFQAKINEKVSARIEAGIGDAGGGVSIRQSHFIVKAGPGSVIMGSQNRIFAQTAWAADNMSLATDGPRHSLPYGSIYSSRQVGVSYKTNQLGPAVLKLGLFQSRSDAPGAKDAGGADFPDIELGVDLKFGAFGASVAYHQGQWNNPTTDDSGNATTDSETPSAFTLALKAKVAGLSASLVHTAGDPVFTNLNHGVQSVTGTTGSEDPNGDGDTSDSTLEPVYGSFASVSKGLKDKVAGTALWLGYGMGNMNFGLYYGMETTTKSKDNGGVDRNGTEADVDLEGTSIGLHFGYTVDDVNWVVEFDNSSASFDGEDFRDDTTIAVGAVVNFAG